MLHILHTALTVCRISGTVLNYARKTSTSFLHSSSLFLWPSWDQQVLPRTFATGQALRKAVTAATMPRFSCVGEVRGNGLAMGIEFVACAPSNLTPNPQAASACKLGLRARGVLVGTSGPFENVLKVRPPLAFTATEVPLFVTALVETLVEMELVMMKDAQRKEETVPKARL